MIPRFRPPVDPGVLLSVVQLARPDAVRRYESAFADAVGMRHAVAFSYGRTAIRCFLESHGLASQEVICPAYSCVVVAHAVIAAIAEIDPVDVVKLVRRMRDPVRQ